MTIRFLLLASSLLFASACEDRELAPAPEPEAALKTPTAAYKANYRALKEGDYEAAVALTAGSEHIPHTILQETVTGLSEAARLGRLAVLEATFGENINQDCAVVICDGNSIHIDDYRAVYLLQEEGEWKPLWTATIWELPGHALTEAQQERFRKLEAWFESQKKTLPERRGR